MCTATNSTGDEAQPDAAHLSLVDLERAYDIRIVTQNVDDLPQRPGSSSVLHLRGEIRKARSTQDPTLVPHQGDGDIHLGDRCARGSQLRAHIVWFGESVPVMEEAAELVREADFVIVVGTSLVVYPASSLVFEARTDARRIMVNPEIPRLWPGRGWRRWRSSRRSGCRRWWRVCWGSKGWCRRHKTWAESLEGTSDETPWWCPMQPASTCLQTSGYQKSP